MTRTKGTKEWAPRSLNICYGCPNNCVYCYARRMAYRFGRIESLEDWKHWSLNYDIIEKGYREVEHKSKWDYMFPTSHDIFPAILDGCIEVLRKVLEAGNTVLITTKPNIKCIKRICKEFTGFKDRICFRFTITSKHDTKLLHYEPNAPLFIERFDSLKYAYHKGFTTSVSIEPFLDEDPIPLIHLLQDYVNDTIWVGLMSGAVPEELKGNYTIDNLLKVLSEIKNLRADHRARIRLKDSIVNKLELGANRIGRG